jgi:hypothetical protein
LPDDVGLTQWLVDAGTLLGVDVLDHIILGDGRYYSFREGGRIGASRDAESLLHHLRRAVNHELEQPRVGAAGDRGSGMGRVALVGRRA